MINFVAMFAVLINQKIQFMSFEMSGNRYPIPDDSRHICSYIATKEPYHFLDIVGVIDMKGNIVWEDLESA